MSHKPQYSPTGRLVTPEPEPQWPFKFKSHAWLNERFLGEVKTVVLGFDYSAVEARVAAHIARQESNILMPIESWPLSYEAIFYDELGECTWPWWQKAWWWLVDLVRTI